MLKNDWQLIINRDEENAERGAIEILTYIGAMSPTLDQVHRYFGALPIETVNREIKSYQDLGWLTFTYEGRLLVTLTPIGLQVYQRLRGITTQSAV